MRKKIFNYILIAAFSQFSFSEAHKLKTACIFFDVSVKDLKEKKFMTFFAYSQ